MLTGKKYQSKAVKMAHMCLHGLHVFPTMLGDHCDVGGHGDLGDHGGQD